MLAAAYSCRGLFRSSVDGSRILNGMVLAPATGGGTSSSSAVSGRQPASSSGCDAGSPRQLAHVGDHAGVRRAAGVAGGREEEGLGFGGRSECLPGVQTALQLLGMGPAPAMSEWCILGPAAFISFGVFCLTSLLHWCQVSATHRSSMAHPSTQ